MLYEQIESGKTINELVALAKTELTEKPEDSFGKCLDEFERVDKRKRALMDDDDFSPNSKKKVMGALKQRKHQLGHKPVELSES